MTPELNAKTIKQLTSAVALFNAGEVDRAEALFFTLPEMPNSPTYFFLKGKLEIASGKMAHGLASLLQASSLAPQHPALLLALGNAYRAQNDCANALLQYENVLKIDSGHVDAWFNRGLCCRELGQLSEAIHSFYRCAQMASHAQHDAIQNAVNALAMQANQMAQQKPDHWLDLGDAMDFSEQRKNDLPSFSIVICSIDSNKFAAVCKLYRALIPSDKLQIIGIHDAKGMSEAYNRAIPQCFGDIVIFCHDDIEILNAEFAPLVAKHLKSFDAIGVAGTTKLTGPAIFWSGNPHSKTWVTQFTPAAKGPTFFPCVNQLKVEVSADAEALDGVFIAVNREVLKQVQFDERATGFHFYDLAFTHALHRAGFKLAVVPDLYLVHYSEGNFDHTWQSEAQAFVSRHPELSSSQGQSFMFNATVYSRRAVIHFYESLAALSR